MANKAEKKKPTLKAKSAKCDKKDAIKGKLKNIDLSKAETYHEVAAAVIQYCRGLKKAK